MRRDSQLKPTRFVGAVPELASIANLTTKKIFGVFSENMGWEEYATLARAVGEEIEAGTDGIVIGHGTDTMGHTAAILSFMVQNSPVPIVLVGSQRSSDRPSSDAAINLIHSVQTAARGPIAEVQILATCCIVTFVIARVASTVAIVDAGRAVK